MINYKYVRILTCTRPHTKVYYTHEKRNTIIKPHLFFNHLINTLYAYSIIFGNRKVRISITGNHVYSNEKHIGTSGKLTENDDVFWLKGIT